MIKHRLRLFGLIRSLPIPDPIAGCPASCPAGTGRNSVADRPQDFRGGLRPAVRSVQHHNPLFGDQTIAQAAPSVTLRQPRNWQCVTSTLRF